MKDSSGHNKSIVFVYNNLKKFLTYGIWSKSLDEYPPIKSKLYRHLRVLLLALRGFSEDKVLLRASALTYFTLMSIVPILAMGFGIAKGFGLDKYLKTQLLQNFQGQEEVLNQLISFSDSLLQRTGGGLIAGIGVAVLFYSVLKVFGHIENSFNDIWRIAKGRTLARKFSDYLSMMVIAPVLIIASSGFTVYAATQISRLSQEIDLLSMVSPFLLFTLKFAPFVIIWILFTVIYIVMPNTKVNLTAGIVSGIIAGTAFSFVQWFYIDLQVGVSKYNAIYGSFAAIPLLLAWLQLSWLIVLFGAEISFSYQNQNLYEFETETENISHYSTRIIALLITNKIVKRFVDGQLPLTAQEISKELKLPIRLVRVVLNILEDCRIVSLTYTKEPKNPAYQPAQHVEKMTVSYIINAIDREGTYLENENPLMQKIQLYHKSLEQQMESLPENTLVKDL